MLRATLASLLLLLAFAAQSTPLRAAPGGFALPTDPLADPLTDPVATADEPARVGSLIELIKAPEDKATEAVLGWLQFFAAGYKGSADLLGHGDAADAELMLGELIEKSARAALEAQIGKKGKVKLNDAADGPVTKVDDSGVTITLNKAETLVTWGDIDPKQIGLLISKAKPTAEGEIVAAATLKLLAGDTTDAKQRAAKLTSEAGKKLGELLEDMKDVGPALKAGRALDGALREPDATKAVERFKAAWPEAKKTDLGIEAQAALRAQFVIRGTAASGGQKALAAAFNGKVTTNPSKLHPDAGPGGMGLIFEWDYEKDGDGRDFDPALLPRNLLSFGRTQQGASPMSAGPFLVSQSRLMQDGDKLAGGALPLEFCADVEIEMQGGIVEQMSGRDLGRIICGVTSASGNDRAFSVNFVSFQTAIDAKDGPSWEKPIEDLAPGMQFATVLRLAGEKATFSRPPDSSPALAFATKASLRPFVMFAGVPTWFLERLVIKGTATGASLAKLATVVAERDAKALFDG